MGWLDGARLTWVASAAASAVLRVARLSITCPQKQLTRAPHHRCYIRRDVRSAHDVQCQAPLLSSL